MRLTYPFDLPTLPYSFESMHPCISDWTMQTHYECNHAGYVKKLNLILNSLPKLHQTALASIVLSSKGKLFNNAAQHLNHVFWWYTLKPPTILSVPDQPLLTQIQMDFGSFDDWKKDFHEKAMSILAQDGVGLFGIKMQKLPGKVELPPSRTEATDGSISVGIGVSKTINDPREVVS